MSDDETPKTNEEKKQMYRQMAEEMRQIAKNNPESKGGEAMAKMFDEWEPLDPELEEWKDETGFFGECVKHPLVFSVPYVEQYNTMVNQQLHAKKRLLEEYIAKENWSGAVFLHERPYRFEVFYDMVQGGGRIWERDAVYFSDADYWHILSECWTDTENMWQVEDYVRELVEYGPNGRWEHFMSDGEREFLHALPDRFLVYRGHQDMNQQGVSWTLSYWKACWFAQRFEHKGKARVSFAWCPKNSVIGYLDGRNEYEIAVLPEDLEDIQEMSPLEREEPFKSIWELVTSEFKLGKMSHHGPWHWEKVERNVIELARMTPNADPVVCRLFALLHDSQRENDAECEKHGAAAADWLKTLDLPITQEQREKLETACRYHNTQKTSDDPTIGVCFDADRLDLVRVGITPKAEYLSTDAAKKLIWTI